MYLSSRAPTRDHPPPMTTRRSQLQEDTCNQAIAYTLVESIAERYYTAFSELQQRFAKEA